MSNMTAHLEEQARVLLATKLELPDVYPWTIAVLDQRVELIKERLADMRRLNELIEDESLSYQLDCEYVRLKTVLLDHEKPRRERLKASIDAEAVLATKFELPSATPMTLALLEQREKLRVERENKLFPLVKTLAGVAEFKVIRERLRAHNKELMDLQNADDAERGRLTVQEALAAAEKKLPVVESSTSLVCDITDMMADNNLAQQAMAVIDDPKHPDALRLNEAQANRKLRLDEFRAALRLKRKRDESAEEEEDDDEDDKEPAAKNRKGDESERIPVEEEEAEEEELGVEPYYGRTSPTYSPKSPSYSPSSPPNTPLK
jgi:hypothetical protein